MPDIYDASSEPQPEKKTNHHRVNDYSRVMRNEKSSNNALKSFVAKPTKIHFDSQGQNERVLLLMRRHPVTQLKWILIAIVLLFMPILFLSVGMLNFLPPTFQLATLVMWYVLIISFSLESFLNWFYNVYIITDERVIDVDFHNLIYKNISSAKIDVIEDISSTAGGILASIFNYGTVRIQTSAAVVEFEYDDVPQPAKVTEFLNELLLEEEKEKFENRVD